MKIDSKYDVIIIGAGIGGKWALSLIYIVIIL